MNKNNHKHKYKHIDRNLNSCKNNFKLNIIKFTKKIYILILLLFINFQTACTNDASLELMIFVDSIGIDYDNQTDDYILYYHVATSDTLTTTEMGTSSNIIYSIAKVRGKNIYECINKINDNSIKNIDLNHIQTIILTFNFICVDRLKMISDFVRTYRFITPNVYIFATNSKLEDMFSIENPENISPFFSLISSNDYITAYNLTYYSEFASTLYEDYTVTKITVIDCKNNIWQNNDKDIYTIYPTGELYINKEDEKLYIKIDEYKILSLINHEYLTTIIYNNINYSVYDFKIKIKILKNLDIRFTIKGNIYSTDLKSNNSQEIIDNFTTNLKNDFENFIEYTKELNFDIFNLQDKIYRKYNKKDGFNIKTTNIDINVDFKLLN